MWFLYILLIIAAIALVCVIRALSFRPVKEAAAPLERIETDNDLLTRHLQELIRIPTVSDQDFAKGDAAAFAKVPELLKRNYPKVAARCEFRKIGNTGLLYKWPGKASGQPSVLMAHYDVVAVGDESAWSHPPFAAEIADGELWGRGTLDTKITLLGVMEGAETLIARGYVPENDIYLCFSGNEEVAGDGAPGIVSYFASQGIRPALVVDEGGAIVPDLFPQIAPIAVIGTGEKGMMDIKMSVTGEGGHSSHPPVHTALGILAKGIVSCESHPFKSSLAKPIRGLLEVIGRSLPMGGQKLALANLWLFSGILKRSFLKKGGELAAMLRTTAAWDMAEASPQANVLPAKATAIGNVRLMNTESPEAAVRHFEAAVNDPRIHFEVLASSPASPYTDTASPEYRKVALAIRRTWPDVLVSPYLMIACSDSRHYAKICDHICRFSCMKLDQAQRSLIHNYNERIKLPMIGECVQFYLNLIRTL